MAWPNDRNDWLGIPPVPETPDPYAGLWPGGVNPSLSPEMQRDTAAQLQGIPTETFSVNEPPPEVPGGMFSRTPQPYHTAPIARGVQAVQSGFEEATKDIPWWNWPAMGGAALGAASVGLGSIWDKLNEPNSTWQSLKKYLGPTAAKADMAVKGSKSPSSQIFPDASKWAISPLSPSQPRDPQVERLPADYTSGEEGPLPPGQAYGREFMRGNVGGTNGLVERPVTKASTPNLTNADLNFYSGQPRSTQYGKAWSEIPASEIPIENRGPDYWEGLARQAAAKRAGLTTTQMEQQQKMAQLSPRDYAELQSIIKRGEHPLEAMRGSAIEERTRQRNRELSDLLAKKDLTPDMRAKELRRIYGDYNADLGVLLGNKTS